MYSIYFIWTICTSVGYGDYYLGNTNREMYFIMMMELFSVLVPATVIYSVNRFVSGLDYSYENQMRDNINNAYLWIVRLKNSNKKVEFSLPL